MAKLAVLDKTGKQVSDIELRDEIFSVEPNRSAMHLVVVQYLANRRQGTQSTRTRGEVSGGGRKPWRQKGTGRARQGSIRAPQWIHGGVALGPKPRRYGFSVNKKVRGLALRSALSAKVAAGELIVVDDFGLERIRTKEMAAVLAAVHAGKKALIVLPEKDDTVYRSARNIPGTRISLADSLNVYDILNCSTLVVLESAVARIEEVYAS